MDGSRVAKVVFRGCKNCLLSVPQSWIPHHSTNSLQVYELQYSDNQLAYFSWSGDVTSSKQNVSGQWTVELNGFYALKLGMSEGQDVIVSRKTDCITLLESLQAEPVAVDDWEILELHSNYVQNNLMNQVRVVWNDQLLPIWVNQSICIFVKISNLQPPCTVGLLGELTDVHVLPKARCMIPVPTNQNTNDTTKLGNILTQADRTDESVCTLPSKNDKGHEKSKETNDSDVQQWKIRNAFKSLFNNWFGTMIEGKLGNADNNCDKNSEERNILFEELQLEIVEIPGIDLRVHPLDEDCLEEITEDSLTSGNILWRMLKQPTTVVTSSRSLHNCDALNRNPVVIGILEKVIPEYEILDKNDKGTTISSNVKQQKANSVDERKQVSKRIIGKARQPTETVRKMFVKVVILDVLWEYIKQGSSLLEVNVMSKLYSSAVPGALLMHDVTRTQMKCETTSRVRLTFTGIKVPKPIVVNLYSLQTIGNTLSREEIQDCVTRWLNSTAAFSCPLIVTNGSVVHVPSNTGETLRFAIQTAGDITLNPERLEMQPLSICSSLNVDIKFDDVIEDSSWNTTNFNPNISVLGMTSAALGGFTDYVRRGLSHLKVLLRLGPVSRTLWQPTSPTPAGGGLLICGPQGCGRTTLALTLARELYDAPSFRVFSHLISCKSLKGKRVESIVKIWKRAYQEAKYRSPSILILDDLDHLAGSPSGPESEVGGVANYQWRCAEALYDLMKWAMRSEKCKVATIATCKSVTSLHSTLSSPHGIHLFRETISITSPNVEQREQMLHRLILAKPFLDPKSIETIQWRPLATKMEGFLAVDLAALVDRAAHVSTAAKGSNFDAPELMLKNDDFEKALLNYEPVSLRGIQLHRPGSKGWSDVGGLSKVKQALIETLQWPAKYPELFAKCPLPLRSGILLYGPPGTGKTLLAAVVAKECGMNFISIKGPELLSKYIGASEQAVRDLFEKASNARPCIIFFDEFDSLAPRRGHDSTGVTDRVVNQLLTQMDGVEGRQGIYILAATSRPDLIDPALLRPGRLDKSLYCPLPTSVERKEILIALSRPLTLSNNTDLDVVADICVDFSGADLQGLLYNAQLNAIHRMAKQSTEETTAMSEEAHRYPIDDNDDDFEYYPTRPDSDAETGHPQMEVVHLPNLEEGPVSLNPAFRLHLEKQMTTVYSNLHGWNSTSRMDDRDRNSQPDHSVVVVTQEDLMTAVSDMTPSVGPFERRRYQAIYEAFVTSKGGHFERETPIDSRATLA